MAKQRLDQIAVPGAHHFGLPDASVLLDATLGEPTVYYWADNGFADYESAPAADLLQCVRCTMRYPIIIGQRVIGTVSIMQELDGSLKTAGIIEGVGSYSDVVAMQNELRPPDGKRLSVLNLNVVGAGSYYLVDDCENIYQLVPRNDAARRLVTEAAEEQRSSTVSWLDAITNQVKAKLRARRKTDESRY